MERFLNNRITLHCGDCLDVLSTLEPNSIDSAVTDPPYHLTSIVKRFGAISPNDVAAWKCAQKTNVYGRSSSGFMGKQWDGGDIAFRPEVWREVYRVLKPGAHLLAFGGTRTYHRMVCAIEDAGFECRDTISWNFGSGFPKSHNIPVEYEKRLCRQIKRGDNMVWVYLGDGKDMQRSSPFRDADANKWDGFGTALKPAMELIVLARKPLSEKTVVANVLRWGCGALNINGTRVPTSEPIQSAAGRTGFGAGREDNYKLGMGRIYHNKPWENEQSLCVSCAALAVNGTKPTTRATKESIATKPVAQILNEGALSGRGDTDKTDIGCSDGMRVENIDTNSSTSKSGKILTGQSRQDTKSTTKTETAETTTSRICRSCQKPIIAGSTNGRWPSNLIHDGSAEVVEAFPESDANNWRANKGGDMGYHGGNGEDRLNAGHDDSGSAARFFYTAKADGDDRLGSKHPTVKPLDLMQYLVRLITPPKGTCLDPFAGTGTTGEAAFREGMSAVLIERESEYQDDIRRRMKLIMSGPDERARESIKQRMKDKPVNHGPLFGGSDPQKASTGWDRSHATGVFDQDTAE